MTNSQWVLLWSKKQNCFHIEPAQDLFSKNFAAMCRDKQINDYHPVFMGPRESCEKAANHHRPMLSDRELQPF